MWSQSSRRRRRALLAGGGAPLNDVQTLVAAMGGNARVRAIYHTNYNVAVTGGLVQTWDDARGAAGYGPQIVGNGGTKPAFDAVNKIITTSGANWLQTAKSTAFDESTDMTIVAVAAVSNAAYKGITCADDPYTGPLSFSAWVGGSGATGAFVADETLTGTTPDGTTLRLVIASVGRTGVDPNGGFYCYGEVWGRARTIQRGTGDLSKTVGARALCFGGLPNSGALFGGAAMKVQFVAVIDHQINQAEHDAILTAMSGLAPVYDNSAPAIFCSGNSLTYGLNASAPGGATAYPGVLKSAHAALAGYDVVNVGNNSQTGTTMLAVDPSRVLSAYNASRSHNFYIYWEGINDIGTGHSDAVVQANVHDLCLAAKAKGFKVLVMTTIPWGGITGPNETSRQNLNTYIRGAVAGGWADAVVDTAANPNLQTPTNTTYFAADGTHLTDTGYNEVANNATYGVWAQLNALGV